MPTTKRQRQPKPKAQPEVEVRVTPEPEPKPKPEVPVKVTPTEEEVKEARQLRQTLTLAELAKRYPHLQRKQVVAMVEDVKRAPAKPERPKTTPQPTKAATKIGEPYSPLLRAKAEGPEALAEFVRKVRADSRHMGNPGTLSNVQLGEKYGIGDSTARKIAYRLIFADVA